VLIVDPRSCKRLQGRSVRECICKLPNEAGWAQCPEEAQGLLEPVPVDSPPPAPAAAAAKPDGELLMAPSIHAVGRSVLPSPSGEMCESCGSFNTVRTGTCVTCHDCYHAGGCG
jgi:hypothetical protein